MTFDKPALVILVKNPIPGQVKTRLVPFLTAEASSRLYHAFVKDIFCKAAGIRGVQKVLAFSGDPSCFINGSTKKFLLMDQGQGDLGQRLCRIFETLFNQGFSHVVVMGSDSPSLSVSWIQQAFQMFKTKDMVLGPAWDGGYYLIGLKHPFPPELFERISWSTSRVLLETLARGKKIKRRMGILPCVYDVDRPVDLKCLSLDLLSSPILRKELKNVFEILRAFKML